MASPRVVVEATLSFAGDNCRPFQRNKVFIGYAPRAQTLEIISSNIQAGRYEFQIIKDYAPEKTPKLFYARRALCTSCHQAGLPVFAGQFWDETNDLAAAPPVFANEVISALKVAHGDNKIFEGVDIDTSDGNSGAVEVDAGAIDRSVRNGSYVLALNTYWQSVCSSEVGDCRKLTLKHAILSALVRLGKQPAFQDLALSRGELGVDPEDIEYQALRTQWKANWPEDGISIENVLIPDRANPTEFASTLTKAQNPLSPRDPTRKIHVSGISENDFVPPSLTPFPNAPGGLLPPLIERSTPNAFIAMLRDLWVDPIVDAIAKFVGNDRSKIDSIVKDKKILSILKKSDSLGMALVNGLLNVVGAAPVGPNCFETNATLPDPQAINGTDDILTGDGDLDQVLGKLQDYCGDCHGTDELSEYDFLGEGSDAKRLAMIKSVAPEIVRRLNWEGVDSGAHMPPMGSTQHKKLRLPQNAIDRFTIASVLSTL